MTDERLDNLGTYFIYFKIQIRYGVTFEQFVRMVDSGRWEEVVA